MPSESPSTNPGEGLVGREIGGRFVLREVIGEGGTGWVYRADQTALARKVAIKILYPELAVDEELAKRFRQEALAASRLNHPNTVSVIDYGVTPDGLLYLVMEHLRGRTLTHVVYQEGTLPLRRVASLVSQILAALEEAHSEGVVHADLKSDNVMVETLRDGRDVVKVVDFGLARIAEVRDLQEPTASEELSVSPRTANKMICGTPEYMAPEVVCGEEPTTYSDLYAAGIVLYELLCGVTPFHGGRPYEIAARHVQEVPILPGVRRPDLEIDPAMDEIVGRALAKDPRDRFADAREFRTALQGLFGGDEWDQPISGVRERRRTLPPPRPQRTTDPFGVEVRSLPAVWVGRQDELARLETFLRGVEGGLLGVVGPVGSGKSAVCRNAWVAAARAEARGSAPKPRQGARYALVGADPTGLARTWHPIRAALSSLVGGGMAALREGGPPALDLAQQRLVASVLEEGGGATAMDPSHRTAGGKSAPAPEIGEALLRALLVAAARAGGASIVFDDVDRYDRPSRQLLARLAGERADSLRLILVGEQPFGDEPRLEMAPFSQEESFALAAQLGCGQVAQAIATRSGGLPALVHQLCRWYLEGYGLEDAPEGVADLIGARLSKLPRESRRCLQAIAVFGVSARYEHVAALTGTDPAPDVRLLEDRGYLVTRGDEVVFLQDLARDVVYDGTPADVRRQLHADAFHLLEARGESPSVLGSHADLCGNAARAVPLYLSASDAALRAQDPHGAMSMAQRALAAARREMWAGQSDEAQARYLETSIRLADVLTMAGNFSLARGVLEEAGGLAAGGPRPLATELARAVARVAMASGDTASAVRQLRSAVGTAIAAGDLSRTAVLYAELGSALARSGAVEEATAELQQGIDLVTLGDGPSGQDGPAELWRLVIELARLLSRSGELRKAQRLAQDALRHAERVGVAPGRRQANLLLAELCDALGDRAGAQAHRRAAGS